MQVLQMDLLGKVISPEDSILSRKQKNFKNTNKEESLIPLRSTVSRNQEIIITGENKLWQIQNIQRNYIFLRNPKS